MHGRIAPAKLLHSALIIILQMPHVILKEQDAMNSKMSPQINPQTNPQINPQMRVLLM